MSARHHGSIFSCNAASCSLVSFVISFRNIMSLTHGAIHTMVRSNSPANPAFKPALQLLTMKKVNDDRYRVSLIVHCVAAQFPAIILTQFLHFSFKRLLYPMDSTFVRV